MNGLFIVTFNIYNYKITPKGITSTFALNFLTNFQFYLMTSLKRSSLSKRVLMLLVVSSLSMNFQNKMKSVPVTLHQYKMIRLFLKDIIVCGERNSCFISRYKLLQVKFLQQRLASFSHGLCAGHSNILSI
jgi:hypothetical protein